MSGQAASSSTQVTMYMAFNFLSSVGIIAVNKIVFKTEQFDYSTLLTALHFIATFLGLVVCNRLGMFEIKNVPLEKGFPLIWSFCGFVIFNNLSLQYNSVGFYQLMKVLTTPVIVVIEYFLYDVKLHDKLKLSLVPVCIGVAMATVSDVQVNFWGTIYAILGIASTSVYQIMVKAKQQDLGLNSYQLLYFQAPLSAAVVMVVSMLSEPMSGPTGWMNYNLTAHRAAMISLSCVLAFCVNLSIFLVIGKTSPVSYNVLGHFKLCVILLTGFIVFGEEANTGKVLGTLIAFVGITAYTHLKQNIASGWDNRQASTSSASSSTNISSSSSSSSTTTTTNKQQHTREQNSLLSSVDDDEEDMA